MNGKCCLFKLSIFECECYHDRYKDLQKAFGKDCKKLEKHFRNHGHTTDELRNGMCTDTSKFDCDCFMNKNDGFKKYYCKSGTCSKADCNKAMREWKNWGHQREGLCGK